MHDLPLITTIAVAFTAAWLLGLLTQRLGLSPIVGYLLAGVMMSRNTPGFVGDIEIAHQLAEVGVILLMFGVGLHFHLSDLIAVKSVAIPGAVGQSLVAMVLAIAVYAAFGVPLMTGAVIGMAIAVASTVVLMRVLMDADVLNSPQGHVAVGWLLVEDIFTVVVLVLIPIMASGENADAHAPAAAMSAMDVALAIGLALAKLGVLVTILLWFGPKIIPWALVQVARLRSRELFTLTVLVFSIAMAAAAYAFFGASMALGAFLAGMVVAQSPASHQAAADALPMRDAFAVIFFVSVGMIFDPMILVQHPLLMLATLGIILLAKPLTALAIVAILGHSVRTALTVALGLAQIGEFSFILADVASDHGLLRDDGYSLLVGAAIITITLNPMLFRLVGPIENWLRARPTLWKMLNGRAERRSRQENQECGETVRRQIGEGEKLAIVVGFGPVGRSVHRLLREAGLATVVIDMNMDTVSELNAQGQPAVFGDASRESILEQAGMRLASHLVLTLPHSADRMAIVIAARGLNATARILVRAHYLREREDLERSGATTAVFEEAETAVALARLALAGTGAQRDVVESKVRDLRLALILENMSNIRAQRVRSVMMPWSRVQRLSATATRAEVFKRIAEHRYSRWPVVHPQTGTIEGYLLAKDLIAVASVDGDWLQLIRPIRSIRPDDDIESTLHGMQSESATICIVQEGNVILGMLTLEDILEQVVGRIEDEYSHERSTPLRDAIRSGGVVLDLAGMTPEQVIYELADAIPANKRPPKDRIAEIAFAREQEVSTDLGVGVAIPHARCPNLRAPLVVLGRSENGILFSPYSPDLVRLVFLLVTPSEHPETQLSLLSELAKVAGDESVRQRLLAANSKEEVLDAIAATNHAARSDAIQSVP